MRHVGADAAEDVVADTFFIAWQRRTTIPPEAPLPWLLVVARNVIANHRRAMRRRDALQERVADVVELARIGEGADASVESRDLALQALGGLSAIEREAVLLTAWDGLSPPQAAQVAGCSVNALNVRLSRARAHIARAMAAQPPAGAAAPRSTPQAERSRS
jgi:RNA polymerase sigma-70 factor (ECF subfamily)